jgi:hypothetical protein
MRPDQGWDFLSIILVVAVVLAIILAVPIAMAVKNELHKRRMRRHFSDTRGRRRKIELP